MLQANNISDYFPVVHGKISLLRCDLFEPDIPGNKYWKLKYNITEMRRTGLNHMLTFGGAYSNHIAATAAAGRKFGFKTTGIIRGEKESFENHTLQLAQENGMNLHFIDRDQYRQLKGGKLDVSDLIGTSDYYILPEGGSNAQAVSGCKEIISLIDDPFDVLICAVGTGANLAGLIAGSVDHQQIIGFPAVKGGEYLKNDIRMLLENFDSQYNEKTAKRENWSLVHDYHFGGFAKIDRELIGFYKDFLSKTGIELDLIYTSKMMFGLRDMLLRGLIDSGKNIAIIHSGGIQGNVSLLNESHM